jgi:hypothetical protein
MTMSRRAAVPEPLLAAKGTGSGTAAVENRPAVPKVMKIEVPGYLEITLMCVPKKNENIHPEMHTCVHRQMDTVWSFHTGATLSHEQDEAVTHTQYKNDALYESCGPVFTSNET